MTRRPTDTRLFVVIPVRNRLEYTRACLSNLLAGGPAAQIATVVVVDDGSTDGSGELLPAEFPVRILRGHGQLWWAGAMNYGMAWVLARAADDDVVLSLNNDTVPPPGYLDRLLRAHAQEPAALIGSVLVKATDRRTIIDGGVQINWATAKYLTMARGERLPRRELREPRLTPVDVLSGCGTLIPVRALRRVGPFRDAVLPHYSADYEFSRRAVQAGFGLFVDQASPLYVHEEATGIHAAVAGSGLRDLLRSFWSRSSANDFRTRMAFALTACPRWALPLYIPLDYGRVIFGSLCRHLSGKVPEHEPAGPGATK